MASAYIKYDLLTRLKEYPRLMRIMTPLSHLQNLVTDLKLRCKAILVASNSFFYNEDYEEAAVTSDAAIQLLLKKVAEPLDPKDAKEFYDLLAKSYMMKGLSKWIPAVPTKEDDPDLLSDKLQSLDEAEASFEQGSLVLTKLDPGVIGQQAIQFKDRLAKVRDAKEIGKDTLKMMSSNLNEDSNSYPHSSMSQISGERSFRINKLSNSRKLYPRKPLQSPPGQSTSIKNNKNDKFLKTKLRKVSTNTDQFGDSLETRKNNGLVYIRSGVTHQRSGSRRANSGKQEAQSAELNKNESQDNNKPARPKKSFSIKKKPSSDQMDIESQTDQRPSPQTQKSNKNQMSDKANSSSRKKRDGNSKNSKSSLSDKVGSVDDIDEEDAPVSRLSMPSKEKEDQIVALKKQIDDLKIQKENLEKMTLDKDYLEKRMMEMLYQKIPMAWFQNPQMMMGQYPPGMYPGYHWGGQYDDQGDDQMMHPHMKQSFYGGPQQQRVPEYLPKAGVNNYLAVPGLNQYNARTKHPVVVVSPAQPALKPYEGDFEPTKLDYTRNDMTRNDLTRHDFNESHIIPRSHQDVGLEYSRDLRSEHQLLRGIPSSNQLRIGTIGSHFMTPSDPNISRSQNISAVHPHHDPNVPGAPAFNETSSMDDETLELQTHQLTLRNYREKTEESRKLSSKGIYLGDFNLNMGLLIEDFRRTINNSTHCFTKSVIIESYCYKIKLQISCQDGKFTAMMSPTPYNENETDELPAPLNEIDFEREYLQEEQFIEMLKQVNLAKTDLSDGQDLSDRLNLHYRDFQRADRANRDAYPHHEHQRLEDDHQAGSLAVLHRYHQRH
jgi:hypothetical protein